MFTSLVVGLLVACNAAPESTNDTSQLLSFIAAQQINTRAVYDTLSYRAIVKTATEESFSPEPFRQTVVHQYSRRGDSLLMTREASHIIQEIEQRVNGKLVDPKFEVQKRPTVKRLLVTDIFTLLWSDVATPRLDLYYATDWADSEEGYTKNLMAYTKAADLKTLCFGQANPFYELLPLSPEFTSWSVSHRSPAELEVKRTLNISPEKKRQDLTLVIDANNGLVTEASFMPGDGWVSTCRIEYKPFPIAGKNIPVPVRYRSKDVDKDGVVIQETDIVFSGFLDESDESPYTLGNIGLPEGAEVWRGKFPSGVQVMKWKGGALEEMGASDLLK